MDYISKTVKKFEAVTSTADENTLVLDTDKGIRKIAISDFKKGVGAGGSQVQDATTSRKGIVKMATKVDAVAKSADTAVSGTSADEAIEAVRLLAVENKTKINAILEALKTAGIMSNS